MANTTQHRGDIVRGLLIQSLGFDRPGLTPALCRYALHLCIAAALCAVMSSPVPAATLVTATSLSSFEGKEEPTVLYHPSTQTFTNDSFTNIVDEGGGLFKYILRYQPNLDWWDGDRSTTNNDRQRAEVKGLGVHQKTDQTFQYSYDFRTDPSFIGTSSFCHIFQLKATDGDNGAPLVTLSLGTNGTGTLRLWSGTAANSSTARSFSYQPNTWEHVDIIIHTATDNTGFVEASLNGDAFKGLFNLPVYRPDATDYRPKWGFYRGINSNLFVGTNYLEDRSVTAIASPNLLGDFNRDELVTSADVQAMLGALSDVTAYKASRNLSSSDLLALGDFNHDGKVTNADIQGLLDRLKTTGSGSGDVEVVSEPTGAVLLAIGAAGLMWMRRRIRAAAANRRKA